MTKKNHLLPDIFETIKFMDSQSQIAELRKNNSDALRKVLALVYNPSINFYRNTLPEYKPEGAPHGLSFSNLFMESKRFYIFLDNYKLDINRKDALLIQILESIHETEVEFLRKVLDKSFANFYNLPVETIKQAIPGIVPENYDELVAKYGENTNVPETKLSSSEDNSKATKRARGTIKNASADPKHQYPPTT